MPHRRTSSKPCSTRPRYVAELQASDDPQDEGRVENLEELVSVAREFEEARPDGTLGDFLEQVSLVADADELPDADDQRRRRHADDAAHRQGTGVPGRVPHRARGRRLPAHALARRPARSSRRSGGSPTSASPAPSSGSTCPAPLVRSAWGSPSYNPASRFLDDIPPDLVEWQGQLDDQPVAGRRRPRDPPRSGRRAGPAPDPLARRPGDRVNHDAFGLGRVVAVRGVGGERRGRGRLRRRRRAPSACCCATPRSPSSSSVLDVDAALGQERDRVDRRAADAAPRSAGAVRSRHRRSRRARSAVPACTHPLRRRNADMWP